MKTLIIMARPTSAAFALSLLVGGMSDAEGVKDFFPEDYAQLPPENRTLVDQLDLQQG